MINPFHPTAVMSRATLGHTGRQIEASVATHIVHAAVAALARDGAALEPDYLEQRVAFAGGARATPFVGLAAAYVRAF